MSESPDKPKRRRWRKAAFTSIALLLALYAGGYFLLGNYLRYEGPAAHVRVYPTAMIRDAYIPLARLEGALRRENVFVSFWGSAIVR